MFGQRTRLLAMTALSSGILLAAPAAVAQTTPPAGTTTAPPTTGTAPPTTGAPATPPTGTPATPSGPATGSETTPPAPAADPNDPVERARVHYERGLQLFNEENYDAALFEFERAYELAPTFKILYNMGRIQRQQNNYAAALRSYARYLREGGASVPAERRAEVEKEIAILKPRTAEVTVKVNVDDADVYADDIPVCTATIESTCVGKSPLAAPIIVNGGRHKIVASKRGYTTGTSLVSVVGSDKIEVKLELISLEAPKEAPKNPWVIPTIVGWGFTAAGLATAIGSGVAANSAADDQEAAVARLGSTRAELDSAQDKTRTLATVSDAFWIGTGVVAAVSTFFTIKAVTWKGGGGEANIQVGASSVRLGAKF